MKLGEIGGGGERVAGGEKRPAKTMPLSKGEQSHTEIENEGGGWQKRGVSGREKNL